MNIINNTLELSADEIAIAEKNNNKLKICVDSLPDSWITDIGNKELIGTMVENGFKFTYTIERILKLLHTSRLFKGYNHPNLVQSHKTQLFYLLYEEWCKLNDKPILYNSNINENDEFLQYLSQKGYNTKDYGVVIQIIDVYPV